MSREEWRPKLRVYKYRTNDGRTGTTSGYDELDAKANVAREAIVHFPMEVEEIEEIKEQKKGPHHE